MVRGKGRSGRILWIRIREKAESCLTTGELDRAWSDLIKPPFSSMHFSHRHFHSHICYCSRLSVWDPPALQASQPAQPALVGKILVRFPDPLGVGELGNLTRANLVCFPNWLECSVGRGTWLGPITLTTSPVYIPPLMLSFLGNKKQFAPSVQCKTCPQTGIKVFGNISPIYIYGQDLILLCLPRLTPGLILVARLRMSNVNWRFRFHFRFQTIPDICHRRHRRRLWRKNWSCGEILPMTCFQEENFSTW